MQEIQGGDVGELIVEEFLEHWPISAKDMEILKKRAQQNHVYRNMLIDKNAHYTAVILKTNQYTSEFLATNEKDIDGLEDGADSIPIVAESRNSSQRFFSDKENSETAAAVREIAEKFNAPDFPVHLSGTPVIGDVIKRWMVKDMRKFMILAVVMIAAFLFLLFRKVSGVLLSLFTVIFSLVCTFGIMAICNVPIKIPTVMLPSFLLAVGVCDSVHILTIHYKRLKQGDSTAFGHLIDDIETQLREHFPGLDYYITGKPMLMLRTLNGIIMSMGKSYLLALTVITLLMIFFVGDLRLGLVSMLWMTPSIL